MRKSQKVIKIFSNGSLMFDNINTFLAKNQHFVFYEKDFKNFSLYRKNTVNTSNIVEIENLKYRKKYFN